MRSKSLPIEYIKKVTNRIIAQSSTIQEGMHFILFRERFPTTRTFSLSKRLLKMSSQLNKNILESINDDIFLKILSYVFTKDLPRHHQNGFRTNEPNPLIYAVYLSYCSKILANRIDMFFKTITKISFLNDYILSLHWYGNRNLTLDIWSRPSYFSILTRRANVGLYCIKYASNATQLEFLDMYKWTEKYLLLEEIRRQPVKNIQIFTIETNFYKEYVAPLWTINYFKLIQKAIPQLQQLKIYTKPECKDRTFWNEESTTFINRLHILLTAIYQHHLFPSVIIVIELQVDNRTQIYEWDINEICQVIHDIMKRSCSLDIKHIPQPDQWHATQGNLEITIKWNPNRIRNDDI